MIMLEVLGKISADGSDSTCVPGCGHFADAETCDIVAAYHRCVEVAHGWVGEAGAVAAVDDAPSFAFKIVVVLNQGQGQQRECFFAIGNCFKSF